MAAQLGSGLAMAHIQNSDLPPSHACVIILIHNTCNRLSDSLILQHLSEGPYIEPKPFRN